MIRRTPIRKVSKKRAAQNREYAKRRKAFLESHKYCQWWIAENAWHVHPEHPDYDQYLMLNCPMATEIHHKRGRTGERLLDETYWMAISRRGHDYIHSHPKEAYEKGYLLRR